MLTQQAHRLRLHARQGLPHVSADRRHIGRALINLISNASDVTEPETPISVRLSQQGRSVRVTVSDRGPRLLNRSRAHRFEGRRTPGMLALWEEEASSLGLAIVEAVIVAHGGSVGEANRPGGGAHVWFELPASSVPVVA
jgi:signal transduction histidine kinase